MGKLKWILVLTGVLLVCVVTAVCFLGILAVPDGQTGKSIMPLPTSVLTPTMSPTAALAPTMALSPTDTPTPTPIWLTVGDIEEQYKELTDLQWEPYAQQLVGKEIMFVGEVIEVQEDGTVQINDGGLFVVVVLHGVPHDVAIDLTKDSIVSGLGTVRVAEQFISLRIEIQVDELY